MAPTGPTLEQRGPPPLGSLPPSLSPPQAAVLVKEVIHEWPMIRPLVLVLKLFLQQRELNEVRGGGRAGGEAGGVWGENRLQSMRAKGRLRPSIRRGVLCVQEGAEWMRTPL